MSQQPGLASKVGTVGNISIVAIVAGIVVAGAVFLALATVRFVPSLVSYSCASLLGVAVCVAMKKRDARGLAIGTLLFAFAICAFSWSMEYVHGCYLAGMPDVVETIRMLHRLMGIITALPILASIRAVVLPFISPKKDHACKV